MSNETMYYPYQNTARQFRDMEAQGIPVTIANLAIHRHREEDMNRERMRHNQTVQESASQRAREANKGKAREVVPDSDEEESEEMYSSPSEECPNDLVGAVLPGLVAVHNRTLPCPNVEMCCCAGAFT
ncbi:hypothetical protein PIB30_023723 [Stylosanthes scabra]|uniref:Uncharacterized protein n=1 Tax=Stylosanthes scabra TaxID=79078 RepID=A0ABU6V8I9_9FABA|nr:hypothetical protein [Stylosanthes scabra]